MTIDHGRIAAIADHYATLDPIEAYYRKDSIKCRYLQGFPRETSELLLKIVDSECSILDVGCGDGHTLIELAPNCRKAVGVDESTYIIGKAEQAAKQAGLLNIEILACKAIKLPFDENTFDLVFSERGPLGHADGTLVESLRVLKQGGLLFFETMGSHHMKELSGPDARTDQDTMLSSLEIERDRLQRHDVQPLLLQSHQSMLQFESIYDWYEYHCSIQRYLENPQPWRRDADFLMSVYESAGDKDGRITLTHHHIWVGGKLMVKAG